jgi:hypothetical protein
VSNVDVARAFVLSHIDMVQLVANPGDYVDPETLSLVHPEFRSTWIGGAERADYEGIDGFLEGWRNWLEPYTLYEVETEDVIDAGDRVLTPVNVVAVTRRDGVHVRHSPAAVSSYQDGLLVGITFYLDRQEAFAAAGIPG